MANVCITGGTGYVGRHLIPRLLERGHKVRGIVRAGSEPKLAAGAEAIVGDVFDAGSVCQALGSADTLVQLVGEPKPNPKKGARFQAIDLRSCAASVEAAKSAGVRHFIYVSVAHPAPMMQSYIEVRSQCESMIRKAGLNATILRPWYVLGPGHRWPYLLLPMYSIAEALGSEGAKRLGLVRLGQMVDAMTWAVEHPALGERLIGVPEIRRGMQQQSSAATA